MNPFDLDSDYDLRRAHPSARYWSVALIAGGIAAGLSTTAYAAKQASQGVYPWSGHTGDYLKGLAKSAGIGFGAGAATSGIGSLVSSLLTSLGPVAGGAEGATTGGVVGGSEGASAGAFGGGATGGDIAAGSVAAESGAQAGLPTVMTPAVANAAESTSAQVAGGAVPEVADAAANLGGRIVDSAGRQIGTALQPETSFGTLSGLPEQPIGPSAWGQAGLALRDVGMEAFKGVTTQTLGDVMEGRRPTTRGLLTSAATAGAGSAAGTLVDTGVANTIGRLDLERATRQIPTFQAPSPAQLEHEGLISAGRRQLMDALSPRGAAERLVGGALRAPGATAQSVTGNIVQRALTPKPPGAPDPFGMIGMARPAPRSMPMAGAMGAMGGFGGGLGRYG